MPDFLEFMPASVFVDGGSSAVQQVLCLTIIHIAGQLLDELAAATCKTGPNRTPKVRLTINRRARLAQHPKSSFVRGLRESGCLHLRFASLIRQGLNQGGYWICQWAGERAHK